MGVETTVLTGMEPHAFWAHFEALTRIPRPSRHEKPVIEHVRGWAVEHGLELHQDSGRNLVLRVPATQGRESAPVVALQGRLDMVCEREPASQNDPAEGRITLPANGTQIAAAEADTTGTTNLGKRVVDHSFQVPLQICWIVTAITGMAVVWLFFGDQTPAPPVPTVTRP